MEAPRQSLALGLGQNLLGDGLRTVSIRASGSVSDGRPAPLGRPCASAFAASPELLSSGEEGKRARRPVQPSSSFRCLASRTAKPRASLFKYT